MKKYFYLIFIFIFFGCTTSPPKEPPSYEQLNKIRTAMGYEAEDRWANWEVKWKNNDGGYIQYRVALYPISNDKINKKTKLFANKNNSLSTSGRPQKVIPDDF